MGKVTAEKNMLLQKQNMLLYLRIKKTKKQITNIQKKNIFSHNIVDFQFMLVFYSVLTQLQKKHNISFSCINAKYQENTFTENYNLPTFSAIEILRNRI